MSRSLNHGFENKCSEETFNDIYNMAFARGKERGFDDGYNKAIEDFYDKVLNFEDYIEPIEENGSILLYSGYAITKMIVMIKEQLKGGSNDR